MWEWTTGLEWLCGAWCSPRRMDPWQRVTWKEATEKQQCSQEEPICWRELVPNSLPLVNGWHHIPAVIGPVVSGTEYLMRSTFCAAALWSWCFSCFFTPLKGLRKRALYCDGEWNIFRRSSTTAIWNRVSIGLCWIRCFDRQIKLANLQGRIIFAILRVPVVTRPSG